MMAKTDYSPEVRAAMAKDDARDKARGIKEGSPQDIALDKKAGIPEEPADIPKHAVSSAHAGLAAGIAHSILAHGKTQQ